MFYINDIKEKTELTILRLLVFLIKTILLNSMKLRLQTMVGKYKSLMIRFLMRILIGIFILVYIVKINTAQVLITLILVIISK
jgi:hypothetical protein